MKIKDNRKKGEDIHHKFSPSTFPGVLQCSNYEKQDSDSKGGNILKDYVVNLVIGKTNKKSTKISLEDRECCEWASEQIKSLVECCSNKTILNIHEYLEIKGNNGDIVSGGYPDLSIEDIVVVLKSGYDFRPDLHFSEPQLSGGYALGIMQKEDNNYKSVYCVEIYIKPQQTKSYWVSKTASQVVFSAVMLKKHQLSPDYVLNQFCHNCEKLLFCPAVNKIVMRTADLFSGCVGKENLFVPPEKIDCGEIMSKAIVIWDKIMIPYGKRLKIAGIELSETKDLPYHRRCMTSPKKRVPKVLTAFNRLDLTETEFESAIELSVKKLSEVYAAKHKMSVKKARNIINENMEDLIKSDIAKPMLKQLSK